MPTTDRSRTATLTGFGYVVALAVAVVAVGAIAIAFALLGETDTAQGALVGGAVTIVLLVVARWRATRRSARAGSAARVAGGLADERDRAIMGQALAVTGNASFLVLAVGSVIAVAGADALALLASLMVVQVAVLVVSFVVLQRRG